MDTPLAGERQVQQGDVVGELVAQCDSEVAVNRMPDIINNEDHNQLATTLLNATEYAVREEYLQVPVETETQATAEQLAMQESCQLQRQEDVWHLRVACMKEPQTSLQPDAHLNKINGELNVETAATATTATATPLWHATKLSGSKLTANICAPSSSTSSMLTTATTTNAQGTPMDACSMPATSPVQDKQNTSTLQLLQSGQQPQQQQQQQQVTHQEQLILPQPPAEDDNRAQRVDADDELIVDALPATGGVQFPQSNYPISCINQAAIHATSKLATQHNIVAAATDGHGHGGVTCGATGRRLTTPEQTRDGGAVILPAAYLTTTVLQHKEQQQQWQDHQQQLQLVAQQQKQQQQQQFQHPQLLLRTQHFNYINASNSNSHNNNNNNNNTVNINDKNLLPPSHVAHTKTLQKQMFGPKSLNQRPASAASAATAAAAEAQPATPKIIHAPTATTTLTKTPCASMATPNSVGVLGVCFSSSSILAAPSALSATPVLPPPGVSTQRSSSAGVDITQLGTLV
ncbi:unnamed protein product [Ceratitis capitata]|uniref:(Mediterranean fruit fly) hypothetical protein n=1 Tax=Ceratitis capitata TaxID=7213 RepID=A0A811UZH0_CERCA|nr:unnamed protein product [Ceratitis capitata]